MPVDIFAIVGRNERIAESESLPLATASERGAGYSHVLTPNCILGAGGDPRAPHASVASRVNIHAALTGEILADQGAASGMEGSGASEPTESDRLLHLYRRFSEQVFSRISGLYAALLWDETKHCLWTSSDRVGASTGSTTFTWADVWSSRRVCIGSLRYLVCPANYARRVSTS